MSCDISGNSTNVNSIIENFIFYGDEYSDAYKSDECTTTQLCLPSCQCDKCNKEVDDECDSIASHCSDIRSVESFDSFNESDNTLIDKEIIRAQTINHNRHQERLKRKIMSSEYTCAEAFNNLC